MYYIFLDSNSIKAEGIKAIGNALKDNNSLTILIISKSMYYKIHRL